MKLRTSFFNPTVLKKDIARFFPLWGLVLIFQLLMLSLSMDDSATLALEVVNSLQTIGIAPFFYGGLCALLLFGDLFKTRSAYALHAMPMRREGWFLTHLTAAVILYLLPQLPEALVCGLLLRDFWYLAALRLLIGFVMFLFFFGIGAFSCQCAGNRLGAVAVYMLINFFSVVILYLVDTFYKPMLPGVVFDERLALYLSPLVAFNSGKFVKAVSDYNLYNLGKWTFQFQGFVEGDWLQLLIAFGLALVILGLALLLYRRRHIETAGDFITIRFMAPIFLVLYSFCIGYVFYLFGDSYIFLLIGMAVGFFTGLMLLHKKVNVFRKKAWLSLGVFLVVFLATLGITKLDPFGVVNYVPSASQVEKVTISTSFYYGYSIGDDLYFEDQVVLETPEELAALENLHQDLLDEKQTDSYTKEVMFVYQLKNGSTVHRQYSYSSKSISSQVRPLVSRLDLFEDPAILERVISVSYESEDRLTEFKLTQTDGQTLDKNPIAVGLWEAAWKDCELGNMAQDWNLQTNREGWMTVVYLDENGKKVEKDIQIFTAATNTIRYMQSAKS